MSENSEPDTFSISLISISSYNNWNKLFLKRSEWVQSMVLYLQIIVTQQINLNPQILWVKGMNINFSNTNTKKNLIQ